MRVIFYRYLKLVNHVVLEAPATVRLSTHVNEYVNQIYESIYSSICAEPPAAGPRTTYEQLESQITLYLSLNGHPIAVQVLQTLNPRKLS